MRKLSFAIMVVFISAIVSCCQPPRQENGAVSSPSQSVGNNTEQPIIQQPDSSIEKAIQGKNLKDSVMNGQK